MVLLSCLLAALVAVLLVRPRSSGREAARLKAERDEALARLQASEAQSGLLLEEAGDCLAYQCDAGNRVVRCSPSVERILGWRVEEVPGLEAAAFYPEEEARAGKPKLDLEGARAGRVIREETWRVRKDGSRIPARAVLAALEPAGFVAVIHDLTAAREAERRFEAMALDLEGRTEARTRQLRESEARLQGFLRHAPAGIAVKDPSGRLLLVNRRAEALIGLCQAATPAGTGERLFPPAALARDREQDERVLARREEVQAEETVVLPDGSVRGYLIQKFPLLDPAGRCLGVGVIATNITHLKQAERAERNHEKRDSLRLLAGGVAHDFNNILGAMQGNVELAKVEQGPMAFLDTLEGLIDRATGLVDQVLTYAGLGRHRVQAVDLNLAVEEMTRILRASLPPQVVLDWQPGTGLPPMEGDEGQIRQAYFNLVVNSAEALEPQGGRISIRTGREALCRAAIERDYRGQDLEPGPHLTLEVSDSGPGMPLEVQERIFDPFFTTRLPGRGLGLSAVQGILRSHLGGIRVSSGEGRGATFKILFPVAPAFRAAPAPVPAEEFRGSGMVLVVDDEDAVRSVAVRALRRLGFGTLEARNGLEALSAFSARRDAVRLILMDLTMPRMGGMEAYRELRRAGALVPILLSSGFGPEEALERFRGLAPAGFLQKPYHLRALEDSVRAALDGMDGGPGPRGNPPREPVAWIPEFETGHALLDAHHAQLVRNFNHLVAATEARAGGRGRQVLAFLLETLTAHAAIEEELMARTAFAGAMAHRAVHAGILVRFQDLVRQADHGEPVFTAATFNFLEDALLSHFQIEDREFARHLKP